MPLGKDAPRPRAIQVRGCIAVNPFLADYIINIARFEFSAGTPRLVAQLAGAGNIGAAPMRSQASGGSAGSKETRILVSNPKLKSGKRQSHRPRHHIHELGGQVCCWSTPGQSLIADLPN
jgi:hypothetical protein